MMDGRPVTADGHLYWYTDTGGGVAGIRAQACMLCGEPHPTFPPPTQEET